MYDECTTATVDGQNIEIVQNTRFVRVEIQDNLDWSQHVQILLSTLSKGLFAMQQIKHSINKNEIRKV